MSAKPQSVTLSTRSLKTCLTIVQITLWIEQRQHGLCFRYLSNYLTEEQRVLGVSILRSILKML